MKKIYIQPTTIVAEIQQQHIICNSEVDVIPPGQPNQPAGARRRGHDVWDEEEEEEDF